MDIGKLKDEIVSDPLGRNYIAMTDNEVALDLNTEYRERNISIMDATEILNSTNKAEYDLLNADNKEIYWKLLHIDRLNPWGIEASIMIDLFGADSQTIQNLGNLRKVAISRAAELGLPRIYYRYVTEARET